MVSFEENEYNMSSLSKLGLTRKGAIVMACLISMKAL